MASTKILNLLLLSIMVT